MPDAHSEHIPNITEKTDEKSENIKDPSNPPKNDFVKIPKFIKFVLCADLNDVPGSTNHEKQTATDHLYNNLKGYEGSRTVTHRKRKLILAYFNNDATLDLATKATTSQNSQSLFVEYNEEVIDQEITQQWNNKKTKTICAMNIHHYITTRPCINFFLHMAKLIDLVSLENWYII